MKLYRLIKKLLVTGTFILLLNIFPGQVLVGQTPPPPPPPPNSGLNSGHGLGGNQGAPGAPIGSGLEVIIILGILYAGKRLHNEMSVNELETEDE
jgi:hypothetical protein